jgi:hypothetical protein
MACEHYASLEVVQYLVEKGGDVFATNSVGVSSLNAFLED